MNINPVGSCEWGHPFKIPLCVHTAGYAVWLLVLLMPVSVFCWADTLAPSDSQKFSDPQKTVSLVTSIYPPYLDPELPDQGLRVAIARAAFFKVGYKLNVTFKGWASIQADVKGGQFDGVLGVWFRESRQQWLAYSQPIGVNRIVLFKHRGLSFEFTGFESLSPYSVGVVTGYATTPEFSAANLNIKGVNNDEQNLDKLINRQIDFTLMDDLVMHSLINKKYPGLNVIEEVGVVVESEDSFVGFSKGAVGYQQTLTDFNIGLAQIRQDGTFARIVKKYDALAHP